ncbi:MAG TPA: DMT family transporter [Acidimicrobiales bacterium]|nr:DMT family transporter [Acidimicrobiales bacterium]
MAVVLAAVAFGSTFVPVQDAIRHAGTVPFLAIRFLFGAALLVPFARRRINPRVLAAGVRCGVPLLAGYLFQTVGLRFTTTSISAFVTYLLVVIVPLLEAARWRRPPPLPVAAGVVLATAGLFLLTGARLSLGRGVLLTLGCAVAFAVNIVEIDRAVRQTGVDPIPLTAVQLGVVGLGCLVPGALLGGYAMPASSYGAALYTGVVASALAFGLQVWGQRRVGPTRTSLLLMIEPVTAAVIGAFTGARLGVVAALGAGLILAGIVAAEARGIATRGSRLLCSGAWPTRRSPAPPSPPGTAASSPAPSTSRRPPAGSATTNG